MLTDYPEKPRRFGTKPRWHPDPFSLRNRAGVSGPPQYGDRHDAGDTRYGDRHDVRRTDRERSTSNVQLSTFNGVTERAHGGRDMGTDTLFW